MIFPSFFVLFCFREVRLITVKIISSAQTETFFVKTLIGIQHNMGLIVTLWSMLSKETCMVVMSQEHTKSQLASQSFLSSRHEVNCNRLIPDEKYDYCAFASHWLAHPSLSTFPTLLFPTYLHGQSEGGALEVGSPCKWFPLLSAICCIGSMHKGALSPLTSLYCHKDSDLAQSNSSSSCHYSCTENCTVRPNAQPMQFSLLYQCLRELSFTLTWVQLL